MDETEALRARRVAAGRRILADGASVTYVRGVDAWNMQAQRILPQRTHVLGTGKLACGRQAPNDSTTVDEPDDDHPICDSCAQAIGIALGGM